MGFKPPYGLQLHHGAAATSVQVQVQSSKNDFQLPL